MTVEYRALHDMADFERVVDMEIAVWGFVPREAVPSSLMHALAANGTLVAGAYDEQQMVGMALAVPARRGRDWLLWSHMAAVLPEYRSHGIGFGLKQFQRTWALEQGYDKIAWTYDPLQRGNASFNLHRLGAISNVYHVDFYGVMTDAINMGLPSDRTEAVWKLRDARVVELAEGKQAETDAEIPQERVLLEVEDFCPLLTQQSLESSVPAYFVEIPYDLSQLRRRNADLALQWRLALREVLVRAFQAGWYAADFVTRQNRCWYVLHQPQAWFLYVVRCSDQSLYTGVTTDLRRRLDVHNAGRGASYTAARRPVQIIAAWRFHDRSSALKAEAAFKRQSRQEKLYLISHEKPYREMAFVKLD